MTKNRILRPLSDDKLRGFEVRHLNFGKSVSWQTQSRAFDTKWFVDITTLSKSIYTQINFHIALTNGFLLLDNSLLLLLLISSAVRRTWLQLKQCQNQSCPRKIVAKKHWVFPKVLTEFHFICIVHKDTI